MGGSSSAGAQEKPFVTYAAKRARSSAAAIARPRQQQQQQRARLSCIAAASARPSSDPSIQLATAPVPGSISVSAFTESLYQWAATMGQSGANYPTVLPLKVDKLDTGFVISMMKSMDGGFASAGDIQVTVEDVGGGRRALMVRFFQGPASLAGRLTPAPSDPQERLDSILSTLVDVDTIMATMPEAIRKAATAAKSG